jgi:hypothetical protein
MAGPLYNNIAGTVTANPTTGSFTPTGAYTGSVAWSSVPTGVYPYRADGAAGWEIGFTLWNGTTLTRGPLYSSNSNAAVSFGTDVVIQLTNASERVQSHLAATKWGMWVPLMAGSGMTNFGLAAPTIAGTASAAAVTSTNMFTRMPRLQTTTTPVANGLVSILGNSFAGSGLIYSTDSNDVGFELVCRFGFSVLPTNPRIFIGMAGVVAGMTTVEPSTLNNSIWFGKDSTDTNWQLVRRGTSATKTDVGFAPALNVPYEVSISKSPGNSDVKATLFCLDGSQAPYVARIAAGAANLPATNSGQVPAVQLGLNGTDLGTGATLHFMQLTLRTMI